MRAFLTLLFLLAISSCKTENQFTIKGTIDGNLNDEWIYLNEFMEPEPKVDSALIRNGKFSFAGTTAYPEVFVLHNKSETDFRHFYFFLEPVKMKIEIDHNDWAWNSEVLGGPVNDEYNKDFRIHLNEAVAINRETDKKLVEADSIEQIEIEKIRMEVQDQLKKRSMDYISNHPDSPISPYLLGELFFSIPFDESQDILNSFSDENKQTSICLSLQDRLDMMKEYDNRSIIGE